MKAPNGLEITGTLEVMSGRANGRFDETGEFEYSGDTEIWWDEQKTVERGGEAVYVDDDGGEWLKSQLISSDAEHVAEIEPWHRNEAKRRAEIEMRLDKLFRDLDGSSPLFDGIVEQILAATA